MLYLFITHLLFERTCALITHPVTHACGAQKGLEKEDRNPVQVVLTIATTSNTTILVLKEKR